MINPFADDNVSFGMGGGGLRRDVFADAERRGRVWFKVGASLSYYRCSVALYARLRDIWFQGEGSKCIWVEVEVTDCGPCR